MSGLGKRHLQENFCDSLKSTGNSDIECRTFKMRISKSGVFLISQVTASPGTCSPASASSHSAHLSLGPFRGQSTRRAHGAPRGPLSKPTRGAQSSRLPHGHPTSGITPFCGLVCLDPGPHRRCSPCLCSSRPAALSTPGGTSHSHSPASGASWKHCPHVFSQLLGAHRSKPSSGVCSQSPSPRSPSPRTAVIPLPTTQPCSRAVGVHSSVSSGGLPFEFPPRPQRLGLTGTG